MKKNLPFLFIGLICFGGSCKLVDPSEDTPSYLATSNISVQVSDPLAEGTESHKITDSWVYVNGNFLGVFESPYTVPVITEGQANIEMRAGIKLNGIANTRIIYPFFAPYNQSIQASLLDTFTVNPVYQYNSNTVFPFLAAFDNSVPLSKMSSSDTNVVHVKNEHVFEGTGSAGIFADDAHPDFKIRTATGNNLKLPSGSPSVFVEIDYKCNTPFYVNFGATFPTKIVEVPVIKLNIQENWNKVYVNISPYVRDNNGAEDYFIFFSGTKYPADPPVEIYLDNLKIVHAE